MNQSTFICTALKHSQMPLKAYCTIRLITNWAVTVARKKIHYGNKTTAEPDFVFETLANWDEKCGAGKR